MAWVPQHLKWLVDTGKRLKTADGKQVEVWEFNHQEDDQTLSAWAKHFRYHYCFDCDIDSMRGQKTRKDYFIDIKFPAKTTKLGPGIRAGDFGEILVADYLQWFLGYWVPRVRWSSKPVRDDSPKGSDILGFRFHKPGEISKHDCLAVFETKTRFSQGSSKSRLQEAVNDSAKDHLRIAESLYYVKQKLYKRGDKSLVETVERFQNPVDYPYSEVYGAAALFSTDLFDAAAISKTDTTKVPIKKKSGTYYQHPNRDRLVLIVIRGNNMMNLVHTLYQRAADEA